MLLDPILCFLFDIVVMLIVQLIKVNFITSIILSKPLPILELIIVISKFSQASL